MLADNIFEEKESTLEKTINKLFRLYRNKIDRYIIYPKQRWAFTITLTLFYLIRAFSIGGYYVVSYIFGLYQLHLMVQFFTPLGYPDADEEDEEDDRLIVGELPTHGQDNSQGQKGPLIRSMSEFKFWQNSTIASIISIFCSLFEVFDLPVFWPFLLVYFILLVFLTTKRQLRHMSKHGYSFLDFTRKTKK